MIDQAFKTHKETSFGWVLALQQLVAALKAPPASKPARRYLTPR